MVKFHYMWNIININKDIQGLLKKDRRHGHWILIIIRDMYNIVGF